MIERLQAQLETLYMQADARTRGVLGVLGATARRLSLVRAPEAAASLAYYAIFTLFPLLLLLVALGTSFLRSEVVYDAVAKALAGVFPVVGEELIESGLQSLMLQRTSVGILGLIALLWAATSFFAVLVQHINLAFPAARPSGLIRHRLLALLIVLLVLLLFMGALILSGATGVLTRTRIFSLLPAESVWRRLSFLLPWAFTFILFAALYRWVPNHQASWRASCIGALVATVAWQVAAMAFGLFVSGGLVNYEVVYGSLAAFVALLFWIYLSCYIVLLGAHLAGAVDMRQRR